MSSEPSSPKRARYDISNELDDLYDGNDHETLEEEPIVIKIENLETLRRAILNMRPSGNTDPLRLQIENGIAPLPFDSKGGDVEFGKGVYVGEGKECLATLLSQPFTGISINGMCAQTRLSWWLVEAEIVSGLAENSGVTVWIEPHTMADKLKAYDSVQGGYLTFYGNKVDLEMQSGVNTAVVSFNTVDEGKDENFIGIFDNLAPKFASRITAMDLERKIKAMVNDHDSPVCTIRLHRLQNGDTITTALSFEARATTWEVIDGFVHKSASADDVLFIDFRSAEGAPAKSKSKKNKKKDDPPPVFDAEAEAEAALKNMIAERRLPRSKGVAEFIKPANDYRNALSEEIIQPGQPIKLRQGGQYILLIDHLFDIQKLRDMFKDLTSWLTEGLLLMFPIEDPEAPLVMVTNIDGALGIHALLHRIPDN